MRERQPHVLDAERFKRERQIGRLNMDIAVGGALTGFLFLFTERLVETGDLALAGFLGVASLGSLYHLLLTINRRLESGKRK